MRRYGYYKKKEEDVTKCVVEIYKEGQYDGYCQCSRKRGHGKDGLFCAQHAKMYGESNRIMVPTEDKP